jgi:MFS transporter, MHS family, proline/betaine transporter
MVVLLMVILASGLLTDQLGRKPLLLLATILGFFGALPLFWLLNHPSMWLAQLGQLGLVLIVGLYGGSQSAFLVEAAPLQVRCTVVALGFNISLGVIGGLTPLVASWLVARTGDELTPGFLMMVAAAITFLAILRFPETYRVRLAS